MKATDNTLTTATKKLLLTLILWAGFTATTYSQDSLAYLSSSDLWWLSDSVQIDVAKKLTERETLLQKDSLCKVEKNNLIFQLGIINDKVYTYKEQVALLESINEDMEAKIFFYDEKIALRDSRIAKLRLTKWLVICVGGAAVISTIILATQL